MKFLFNPKFLVGVLSFSFVLFFVFETLAEEHSGGRNNNALFPPPQPNKALSTRPGTIELVTPAPLSAVSGQQVTLKWKESTGATSYHLQVATDPNFKWLKVDEALYNGTSYDLKGLEAGKHYYWRVAGFKADNTASYSKGDYSKGMFETK